MTALQGHRLAEAWPRLDEDELAELAEDIAANGQREPVVIYQGQILDGRNRYAACQIVGIEATTTDFDGDDDDALAFVQSVNNARRHQSKGSLAASWALSMLVLDKRKDGRWAYGSAKSQNSDFSNETRRVLGVIADYAPDLLTFVRDDRISLNAAYDEACGNRDTEREALEQEERIAAEEAEALATLQQHAPAYANKIGSGFQSARVALAAWEDDNRAAAAKVRKAEEAKARKAAEHKAAMTDLYSGMARALSTCNGYGGYDDITELMAEFGTHHLKSPQEARYFERAELHVARNFIDMLIDWQENRHAA